MQYIFVITGAHFKKCMIIGDYFHASNFGFFDTKAGEMLACVGCDSDSKSKLSICFVFHFL